MRPQCVRARTVEIQRGHGVTDIRHGVADPLDKVTPRAPFCSHGADTHSSDPHGAASAAGAGPARQCHYGQAVRSLVDRHGIRRASPRSLGSQNVRTTPGQYPGSMGRRRYGRAVPPHDAYPGTPSARGAPFARHRVGEVMPSVAQHAAKLARVRREYADAARRVIRETDRYGTASARSLANLDRCRTAVAYAKETLEAATEPNADAARLTSGATSVASQPAHLGVSS